MQAITKTYIQMFMEKQNKRVDTLVCLETIPHEEYDEPGFEKTLDYDVLGIDWKDGTYIVLNDWGEAIQIAIEDTRFKILSITPDKNYPTNLLAGVGMNQNNHWKWF
ncbi:hypothetical protein [Bacillus toyonensis]|uniref:hypothetical protein n=1 Tax=Bacillus toyonensis TaxID=155322 RepID=UPI002E1D61FD|nr:hypothetical protein [Bacillus toyonensis]